ncbi:unnamed protein product [Trichobilharzia szidati]|nr:unnamed protein product [Trichobilharzia szidati]
MIEKHCLILAFVWTLFQLSYVLSKEISPAERDELNMRIKHYSGLYGLYKTSECIALLTVKEPEIKWTVKDFHDVIRDSKYQIFANTTVDFLSELKGESNWKNERQIRLVYSNYIGYLQRYEKSHNSTVFENIGKKMGKRKVNVIVPAVFDHLVKTLRDAWTARKDLYKTAAVYSKTENMPMDDHIPYGNVNVTVGDWVKIFEREFVKSRGKVEQECLRISGMQPNITAAKISLKKSDQKIEVMSKFHAAVVEMISELEKIEKLRIQRFQELNPYDIVDTALNAMVRERDHEFREVIQR